MALGPPPAYVEVVAASSSSGAATPHHHPAPVDDPPAPPIWMVQLPPELAEFVPPPSYVESQRASRRAARQAQHRMISRRNSAPWTDSGPLPSPCSSFRGSSSSAPSSFRPSPPFRIHPSPASALPSASTLPSRSHRHFGAAVLPLQGRRISSARSARDLESDGRGWRGRARANGEGESPWPDRVRDVFLSLLVRILLIFLFVVFMRILIAQLAPNED